MSDLEDLCRALEASLQGLPGLAGTLRQRSARLRSLAAEVQQARSRVRCDCGPQVVSVVQGLHEAANAIVKSAHSLVATIQHSKNFVERTISGGGETGVGSGAAGTLGAAAVAGAAASSVPSISDIQQWLGSVNPGFTGDPFDPRSSNCGSCARVVDDKLAGRTTSGAAGPRTLSRAEMEAATGKPQIAMSPAEVEQRLVEAGPGSHAVVGIDRHEAAGHWFNAYHDGNKVWAIDGQRGTISDWPPDYGFPGHPVINWDAGI